ncbi:hypothetical protein DICPUDRAFT_81424 [Dictyostelium purpureum]|uniref:RNA polymerase I associated factor, A49-like protein n=1 Tax=Dictyostelium purpureum TaxID=5786 RepID=F0ZTF6_DICPU|nr:uncharacterized protein DICPUDRAFT_81424 [Dictyostelium purpureum]EGC32782.1 hypothetical protein DICPUDRAFT_81424 [Dictyostelium purpureum]|eukprot:XP_003290705.1 hypothetical protein DICPUDRAFT_81424 [Dictyostelium purpureum]
MVGKQTNIFDKIKKEDKELGSNKPAVLKFSQGLPPLSFVENDPEFVSLSHNKKKRTIITSTDQLEYESQDNDSKLTKYAIGIFDKATKQLKIVPSKILSMEQSVIGYKLTLDSSSGLSREERYDKVKKLAESFGSKVTKKKMQKLEMENVENLDYEKTTQSIADVKNELADKESDEKPFDLPDFDAETNKADEIYNIEAILPPRIFFAINHQTFLDILYEKSEAPAYLPEYFKNQLDLMKDEKDEDLIVYKCKILTFMWYTMILMKSRGSHDPLLKEGCTNDIISFLVSLFGSKTGNKKYIISQDDKLKIYNYLAIFALKLEDFQISDITLLSQALSLTSNTFEKHFARVGCKIMRVNADKRSVRLTAPLQLPKNKFSK